MQHKLAMVVLLLCNCTLLYAQNDKNNHDKGPYPKITVEDLTTCKNGIADLHREEINYIKNEVSHYCNKGEKRYAIQNCKNVSDWLSESSTTSNMAWFMKGSTSCADGYVCYGLSTYNEEEPNEDFIITLSKTTVPIFDVEKVRSEYRKNNAEFHAKYNISPQEIRYSENKQVLESKLYGLALITDKCISKIWVTKRKHNNSTKVVVKKSSNKTP